jgi:ChaB
MAKTKKRDLPSALRNSGKKARKMFAEARDAAVKLYGEGARANRAAYNALKDRFEQVGDRWEKKGKKGSSNKRTARGGPNAKARPNAKASSDAKAKTGRGVDANATKKQLLEAARRLEIARRSTMSKSRLVSAISKANRRESVSGR